MALQIDGLERKFTYKANTGDIELADPDPSLSVDEVITHYSMMYPELVNAKVQGPKLTPEAQEFTFTSAVGVKG